MEAILPVESRLSPTGSKRTERAGFDLPSLCKFLKLCLQLNWNKFKDLDSVVHLRRKSEPLSDDRRPNNKNTRANPLKTPNLFVGSCSVTTLAKPA